MTDRHARRVEQLFLEALELSPAERATFLDEACKDQPALRTEVEALLAADREAEGLLDDSTEGMWKFDELDAEASEEGRRFGPYRVRRCLGEGEVSTVYLAERADEAYRHQVAIKLVRRGMDSTQIVRRFRQERQILAALDHPYIAKLLDGGQASDGRPYFVMEYVDGERIDDYCRRHDLALDDRLELFRSVCTAVQFAHGKLVVHRDLKPSNILVTEKGVPKLLDFGIAKLLDPELSAVRPEPTATVVRLLTPRYASPEQARGEPVTTASDVYSLGILLYELLTGQRPYRVDGLSPSELETVISESRIEPPSSVVGERERRRLRGDLDTIVMTALRKEPERRYGSVQELSEDVRRYLQRLPVEARADSVGYRMGKFLRRHAVGVAAAALVALSLVTGTVVATWQAQVARSERRAAEEERRRAEEQQLRAERVSQFLVDLFEVSDPNEAKGETVTAREVLDLGAQKINRELIDQPEIQATLMDTMGTVYGKLGLYDDAQQLIEGALAIRRQTLGDAHGDVGSSLEHLGSVKMLIAELDEAERLHREALAIRRPLFGEEHPLVAESLGRLARVKFQQGEYADAEQLDRESLDIFHKAYGSEHESVALGMRDLTMDLERQGRYDEAEELCRESLAITRRVLGDLRTEVADGLNNLALILHRQGKLEEAVQVQRQALVLMKKLYGDVHPQIAMALNNLAALLGSRGRYAEAEPYQREALEMQRELLGDDHPAVAASLNTLAVSLIHQGRLREAEPVQRNVLARVRGIFGAEHPHVALSLNNLAVLLEKRREYPEAEELHREALAMRRRLLGDSHPEVGKSLESLAEVRRRRGDHAEAETLYREALAVYRQSLAEDHLLTARTLVGLGELLTAKGSAREAEALIREAVGIATRATSEGHWRVADATSALGACLTRQERFEEAEASLVKSHAVLETELGGAADRTRLAVDRLVELYEAWERPDRAEHYRSLQTRQDHQP